MRPVYEILVPSTYVFSHSLNLHAHLSRRVRELNFSRSFHLHSYIVYADSYGSCETGHLYRLV